MSLTDRLSAQVASNLDAAFASGLPKHIGIAVSGGGDSMALLHLTRAWALARDVTLSAITIDHNLREGSAEEAAHVAQWCADLGVAHTTRVWRDWDRNGNLQDAARQARYRMINDWRGDIEHILIGHTLDDQAENLVAAAKAGIWCGWHDRHETCHPSSQWYDPDPSIAEYHTTGFARLFGGL